MTFIDLRALDGGLDGLKVINNLLKLSAKFLKPTGNLWLETDEKNQPEAIRKITEKNYDEWKLKFISSYKDIFKKERFVELEKE